MKIYREIKAVMLEKHLTCMDVALKTGLHPSLISRTLQGKTNPSMSTIRKIAKGVGRSIAITLTPPTK